MKSLLFLTLIVLVTSASAQKKVDPTLLPIVDKPELPRVLIIGDSISMGYTLPVRELLADVANVHRIPENGGSTRDGIEKLDKWLGKQKWDLIYFNWGLHDLKHWKDGKLDIAGPQLTPVELYEQNLRALVAKLKATEAKLIFAATTPVPGGSAGREAGDEYGYNEAARRVMVEAGVPVDDLHAVVTPVLAKAQLKKNVHFSPDGYRLLADHVAGIINGALKKK